MVNPDELTIVHEKPHVAGDEYVRKNVHQSAYYVIEENGASYDIVIGLLATYRNKDTGEYIHVFTEDHKATTFKDEVETRYQEDGYRKNDVEENTPPLDQAIDNGGLVVIDTDFDAFGIVPN